MKKKRWTLEKNEIICTRNAHIKTLMILLYMDDDDYYPSERVSHSVNKLVKNPKALCGGSSEIYLWVQYT